MTERGSTDQLVIWLDDAYAMESGLISILERHASHFAESMPRVAQRLERHVVESHRHVQRLAECLQAFDVTPSVSKSTLSSVIGSFEGASTTVFADQLVKDALADYA